MPGELHALATTLDLSQADIRARTGQVQRRVLDASPYLDGANFNRIHSSDLERLFDAYDELFFQGRVRAELGATPLRFDLSKRMTSAAGKTARYTPTEGRGQRWFEISVSTTLLFQSFNGEDHGPIATSGIECPDRLSALQRVMEHELIHLVEMLVWDRSSCAAGRFQSLARRVFAHTEHKHKLITPRARAWTQYGIRPGARVRFHYDGVEREGIVNRITKRATVLVEDSRGEPFSDGKRYAQFYVPVNLLKPVG